MRRFSELCRDYLRSCSGNVTIMFTSALVVMLGGAGAAIDYIRLTEQKTVFAAAADAAVLAGISAAREAERAGKTGVIPIAKRAAESAWDANIATATLKDRRGPNIVIKKQGTAWTAELSYRERSPTTFTSLLGIRYMTLEGNATASTTVSHDVVYWDFHVVIDDSSSMGIGATQADMDALQANPNINCTFACHWADYAAGEEDHASRAKAAGIKLRIDIVDEAVDAMVGEMTRANTASNVRSKLWGMNDTAVPLVELTNRLSDVSSHDIRLYRTPVSKGNTDYKTTLEKLTPEVGKAGNGKSSVTPKKAVFIVTDGIHETAFKQTNSVVDWHDHYTGPMDPAFCQAMKDNGVVVGVLYVDYITPAGYEFAIDPFKADILPTLQACATDGLFFNATSPEGITAAMKEMLATAMGLGAVRLTN